MAAFYNQGDQAIYNSGQYFIPQEQYRLSYNAPIIEEEQESSIGIPNTNSFRNFSNSDNRNFTNSPISLISNYQKTIEDRQQKLNNPPNTFLGFNTMRDQELTGADLGEYIGSNTAVPRELTTMGKIRDFMSPQSAQSIMEEGYQEPRFQPGIIGTIMSKLDNYRNLPKVDQAFIAQNMGYTGPTVFGDNSSGLSKDPFGLNTRSAFGNYAERVGVEAEKLGDLLSGKLSEKYGATFNPETGLFENEEDAEAAARANQMTKMLRQKFGFYTNKNLEYADLVNMNAQLQGQQDKDIVDKIGITAADAASTTTQGGGGGIADPGYSPGGGLDASKMGGGSQQAKSGGQKAGGTGRTDGGWGWARGGLISL